MFASQVVFDKKKKKFSFFCCWGARGVNPRNASAVTRVSRKTTVFRVNFFFFLCTVRFREFDYFRDEKKNERLYFQKSNAARAIRNVRKRRA